MKRLGSSNKRNWEGGTSGLPRDYLAGRAKLVLYSSSCLNLTEDETSRSTSFFSALDRLKCPQPSKLVQKGRERSTLHMDYVKVLLLEEADPAVNQKASIQPTEWESTAMDHLRYPDMQAIKVIYPDIVDIGCFSHFLDRVGEHFKTQHLSEFISLFSHSVEGKNR